MFFQYGPEQAWLIRDLLHDWNCLEKKTQMIDCKDTINFKRPIFILCKLNVYSRLTFSKRRKTKLEENKNNILSGVNTFRKKKKEVKLRKNLRARSFGTVPGPILREYRTGNVAIDWLILVIGPLN